MAAASLNDRLRHILDALERLERITAGKSFGDYVADELVHDAVERNIERISEASRHIPAEVKARVPDIPWRDVAAVGNVLRHGYDAVTDARIWSVVRDDAPKLKRAISKLLDDLG